MPPSSSSNERTSKETRLIMARIIILAFVLFFNSITTAYLDTFLPDTMILFNVAKNKTEACNMVIHSILCWEIYLCKFLGYFHR